MIYTEKKIYEYPIAFQRTPVQLQLQRPGRLQFIHCDDDRIVVKELMYANIMGLYPKEELAIHHFHNQELAGPVLTPANTFKAIFDLGKLEVRRKPELRKITLQFLQLTKEASEYRPQIRYTSKEEEELDEVGTQIRKAVTHPYSEKMLDFWCGITKGGPFTKDFEDREIQ